MLNDRDVSRWACPAVGFNVIQLAGWLVPLLPNIIQSHRRGKPAS